MDTCKGFLGLTLLENSEKFFREGYKIKAFNFKGTFKEF